MFAQIVEVTQKMVSFEDWWEQNNAACNMIKSRRDLAFYVWNNKPKTPAKISAKSEGGYSLEFECFWADYPKKIGKGGAYAVWKTLIKNEFILKQVEDALKWQKESQQWKNENGKYIPNPETYLRNRRWEDEAPKFVRPKHEVYF